MFFKVFLPKNVLPIHDTWYPSSFFLHPSTFLVLWTQQVLLFDSFSLHPFSSSSCYGYMKNRPKQAANISRLTPGNGNFSFH